MDLKFNNWSELRFTIPYQIEGSVTPHYDEIQPLKMICVPNFEWKDKTLSSKNGLWFYVKDVDIKGDGIREIKECLAYTCEWELASKTINNIEGTFFFYNPLDRDKSLMHIISDELPGWNIGDIPTGLSLVSRTFDVKEQDIYSFLMNDVSELYECIFQFDTLNQVIHVMYIGNYSDGENFKFPDTSIFLSFDNLIKEVDIKSNVDNVITAMRVYGGDDLSIRGVNPNGTDTIYNINYFLNNNWMSESLIQALQAYNSKYETQKAVYAEAFSDLKKANNELIKLENNAPAYSVEFTMDTGDVNSTTIKWAAVNDIEAGEITVTSNKKEITVSPVSAYDSVNRVLKLPSVSGLSELQTLLNSLEGVRSARISYGKITYEDANFIIGSDGNDGADDTPVLISSGVKKLIIDKKQAISDKELDIFNKEQTISEIVNNLRVENNFTEKQWVELNKYFRFSTFQDNSFIITDDMTYDEQLQVQQDLMDFANKELAKSSIERYTFEIKSINFPALKEFEEFTKQFELGTTITLSIRDNYIVKPLLLGIHLNFEDLTDFSLTYANSTSLDDDLFSIADMLSSANNMAKSVSFDAGKFNYMKQHSNDITDFMSNALNAAKNRIISSDKEEVTIDNHGIQLRQWDEDRLRYSGYETRIISNTIAMSNDGFNTANLALGLIPSPDGVGNVYGFIGSAIVGEIIAGNNLYISNDNNNFTLNHDGCFLNNASFNIIKDENTIILDPTEGFSIYKGNINVFDNRQVYIGSDGNVYFKGNITGGSININDNFIVDSDGNTKILAGTIDGYATNKDFGDLQSAISEQAGEFGNSISTILVTAEGIGTEVVNISGDVSRIIQTANGISTTVGENYAELKGIIDAKYGSLEEIISEQTGSLENSISEVLLTADGIASRVADISGNVSTMVQTAEKISWIVKSGTDESNFTLTDKMAQLVTDEVNIDGVVRFTKIGNKNYYPEADGSNITEIDGGNIRANTISADVLNGGTINAETINVKNLNWNNITKNRPSIDISFEAPKIASFILPTYPITSVEVNAFSKAMNDASWALNDLVGKYNGTIKLIIEALTALANALKGN